jgi:hypothetical protein
MPPADIEVPLFCMEKWVKKPKIERGRMELGIAIGEKSQTYAV